MDDYISKPTRFEDLNEILKKWLPADEAAPAGETATSGVLVFRKP
jgi:hypothetical protein